MDKYEHLGYKTFWLFVVEKSKFSISALFVAVILFFLKSNLGGALAEFLSKAGLVFIGLFLLGLLVSLLNSWLEYSNFKYLLDDNGLKIMHGIVTKEEVAIPYRQIQNVDIEISPLEQILGLSRLIILTAGHEDKPDINKEESEGVLPAIDRNIAYRMREELLNRANIEKVQVQ